MTITELLSVMPFQNYKVKLKWNADDGEKFNDNNNNNKDKDKEEEDNQSIKCYTFLES